MIIVKIELKPKRFYAFISVALLYGLCYLMHFYK